MEKFLEEFAKFPAQQKLIGVVVAIILIAGGVYYLGVSDSFVKMDTNKATIDKQDEQLATLQQQAQNRTQYMREVERLKQRLREAEEQLPKQAEIPKLLRDIAYEAQQSGLR